ncbi:MAG TPA: aminotransferase, partial [Thermoanaerobaculia bacterium]
ARYAIDAGIERCSKRALMLADTLRDKLLPFARVLDRGEKRAALVTADFGRDAGAIVAALRKQKINASATFRAWAILDMTEKRAESALRLSPHYYNTEEEIDTVVEALRKL